MDGKVEQIIVHHVDDVIVLTGSGETCKYVHAALVAKVPTSNPGELTWYTGCVFKRDWEVGTLEIAQKTFIESMVNRLSRCHILGDRNAKDCALYTYNGTKALIRHLHKGHEAQ